MIDDLHGPQHYLKWYPYAAVDFLHLPVHSISNTHLDALNHVWDDDGMWNGRKPEDVLTPNGVNWAGVDVWRDGIVTRGVLLDIPKYRGVPYVTIDRPVTGAELEAVAETQGVSMEPGDAVAIYSGREAYVTESGSWGRWDTNVGIDRRRYPGRHRHAGLDISCLKFIRENDCAVVVWDMHDTSEHEYNRPWTVHSTIWAYGTAVVDAARLDRLSSACRRDKRWEFLLIIAPLQLIGGTGSPVNPLAIL